MTTPFPFVAGQVLTAAQLNDIQNLPISDKTASYTLVVADVYKRTIMNSASATTITVNNSIFTVGDVIQVANKGAGVCTVTAGAGVTINTSGSLALAQYGGGYLLALSASTFTFFNLGGGSAYGTATGGSSSSITVGGINYTLLTFNSTGTLTVTKAGFFDYLLVGAGSGGTYWTSVARAGGGGGSGAVTVNSIYLSTNQTVTIGAGGSFVNYGTQSIGGNTSIGADSPFNPFAVGSASFATLNNGDVSTFCMGGGQGGSSANTALVYNFGLGFNGGNSSGSAPYAGGGGGGNQSVGSNAASATVGGAGGSGFDISSFVGGSASYRATGGGGGGTVTGGAGGSTNASSNSGSTNATPSSAAANSGSGGGAGVSTAVTSGNGGSGVCFIRFKV
jgi:hypothetical protein